MSLLNALQDTDRFISFCTQFEGETLVTDARKAPYRLEVVPEGLVFIPASTGKRRLHSKRYIRLVHDRYALTKSFDRRNYSEFTVESSYHLPLLRRYVNSISP